MRALAEDGAEVDAYTPQQRCEDTLYFALSCCRDARNKMGQYERDHPLTVPSEWYFERDNLRIALDSAKRYHALMVQNKWPIPRLVENMLRFEGLL